MQRMVCFGMLLVGCYNIKVSPNENTPPLVQGEQLSGVEDTASVIEIADLLSNDTDPDGDPNTPLTLELVEGSATNGAATQSATQIIFTPNQDFAGVASFSYIVFDAEQTPSTPATVNINFAQVADAPVALQTAPVSAQEDNPITITLQATDVDGGDLTFFISDPPENGSLSALNDQQNSATVVYTPLLNFSGVDTLQFRAEDPGGLPSNTITVSITITAQNDAPVATEDVADPVLRGGRSVTIPVLNNDTDIDGDVLTPEIIIPPLQGTAAISGSDIIYTSDNITTGTVIFFYAAKDATTSSVPIKVTVPVVAGCGDGVVDLPERCDDNNNVSLDGCEADCTFSCANNNDPDNAVVSGTSCYAVFREATSTDFKQDWNAAKNFCDNSGGDLVIINNLAENDLLRSAALLLGADLPWIGGTDQLQEEDLNDGQLGDDFVWSDGSSFASVNFFNFAPGQPNNSNGDEDCLYMLDNGEWDDTSCANLPSGGLLLVNSMICEFTLP